MDVTLMPYIAGDGTATDKPIVSRADLDDGVFWVEEGGEFIIDRAATISYEAGVFTIELAGESMEISPSPLHDALAEFGLNQ